MVLRALSHQRRNGALPADASTGCAAAGPVLLYLDSGLGLGVLLSNGLGGGVEWGPSVWLGAENDGFSGALWQPGCCADCHGFGRAQWAGRLAAGLPPAALYCSDASGRHNARSPGDEIFASGFRNRLANDACRIATTPATAAASTPPITPNAIPMIAPSDSPLSLSSGVGEAAAPFSELTPCAPLVVAVVGKWL